MGDICTNVNNKFKNKKLAFKEFPVSAQGQICKQIIGMQSNGRAVE